MRGGVVGIALYVHVPFCLKKCSYCDFVSYPYHPSRVDLYLKALRVEAEIYSSLLPEQQKELTSVFVGGGTPTCLSDGDLLALLVDVVGRHFTVPDGIEITVEANPGTLDEEKLSALRAAGVNRLSLGVQACQDRLLAVLGRCHSFNQALESVKLARRAGFENLNVDLIFGIPGQSLADWSRCLDEILTLEPDHVSAYSLQLEEGTPLHRAVENGEIEPCSEEDELVMYQMSIVRLTAAGFKHYEISNFARPGRECRHNLHYWHNLEYLGLGPGAHSYLNRKRFSNTADLDQYAVCLLEQRELSLAWEEDVSPEVEMAETMMLGLRLIEGVELAAFRRRFGYRLEDVFGSQLKKLVRDGLLELHDGFVRLTAAGLPVANWVFMEFV